MTVNSDNQDALEVTGSADISYLSRGSTFRKAKLEMEAQEAATKSAMPPALQPTHRYNNDFYPHQPPPAIASIDLQPSPQPLIPSPSQNTPVGAHGYYPANASPFSLSSILQPSPEDYIRVADEMSGYITWGEVPEVSEMPTWLGFENT